jgi:hypothetical protein
LLDRRSGVDRRFGGERRRAAVAVTVERRSGPDRRILGERRAVMRRALAPRRRVLDRRTRRSTWFTEPPAID